MVRIQIRHSDIKADSSDPGCYRGNYNIVWYTAGRGVEQRAHPRNDRWGGGSRSAHCRYRERECTRCHQDRGSRQRPLHWQLYRDTSESWWGGHSPGMLQFHAGFWLDKNRACESSSGWFYRACLYPGSRWCPGSREDVRLHCRRYERNRDAGLGAGENGSREGAFWGLQGCGWWKALWELKILPWENHAGMWPVRYQHGNSSGWSGMERIWTSENHHQ